MPSTPIRTPRTRRNRPQPTLPALLIALCLALFMLPGLARAQALDPDFNPNANGAVNALAAVGNHYWVGGDFSNIGGAARHYLARLDASGADTGIDLGLDGGVFVIRHDAANNHLYVGGWFDNVAGSLRPKLLRLNATTGALDTSFQPLQVVTVSGLVEEVLVDGEHVLIGGNFTGTGANPLPRYLARLNRADGSPDTDFNNKLPALNNTVYVLLRQADGKLVVGGQFTNVDVSAAQDGSDLRSRLIRLNADGTPDPSFHHAQLNGEVVRLVPGDNGSFYAAGFFTTIDGGTTQTRVAQFNANGSPVAATVFTNVDLNDRAFALVRQADGKLLIGGHFTTVGGQTRNRLARLNADGTLDASFGDVGLDAQPVPRGLLPLPGDRLLIGGIFTTVLGQGRNRIALLNDVDVAFTLDPQLNVPASVATFECTPNPVPAGQTATCTLDILDADYEFVSFVNCTPTTTANECSVGPVGDSTPLDIRANLRRIVAPAGAVPVPVNAPLMLIMLAGLLGFAAQRSRRLRK